ncbi:EthD domain-containing protein [Nocardia sp. alder85J]|uniref:EthD domain-containing protein n=1 Tax=Nocardia sp. alder85J TaxID=2862949 RepID=UPI001CD40D4D|nr:EthD domain-containing protein [Nocardia sp. alder85J]MCX4092572.1 EthD domain-containing protein [Nocardia sp. alder85J]
MIKRIRFATRPGSLRTQDFPLLWRSAVGAAAEAPAEVRPLRIAVCTTAPNIGELRPRHDGVGIEWFRDAGQLAQYERWLTTAGGRAVAAGVTAVGGDPVVCADEAVLRGADWLSGRWHQGGVKLKHMALAVRAPSLTAADFADRWRGHAGTAPGPTPVAATIIPDHVRGLAYVQNHPLTEERPYDAVNEVWFDDPAGLRARVEWFRDNDIGAGDATFAQSWFLAVREEIVYSR